MVKNYFKIAWRNIRLHKAYTAINVLGLGFGICACITIYLIASYELSFEKFHPDGDRIYRIVGDMTRTNGEGFFVNCPVVDPEAMHQSVSGFESSAGFHVYGGHISIPDGINPPKQFDNKIDGSYQSAAIVTWPEYFDVFKYKWLEGNARSLREPFNVVLSESRAKKYFGNIPLADMLGKSVIYDDSLQVHVSGIVEDWNHHTDFGYTDFISVSTATHSYAKSQIPTEDWNSLSPHRGNAFIKLAKGVTEAQMNKRLADFLKARSNPKQLPPDAKLTIYLQPLTEIHFTKEFHRGDDGDDFRKSYLPTLYILIGVALFILILAVVNFINLSTAQSIQRAKEIGVRKVLGSNRQGIMIQFLTETFVLTLVSVFLAVLCVRPTLYLFKDYIPAGVTFEILNPSNVIFLLILIVCTSFFSGFYPARVLASYLPVQSLKGAAFQKGNDKINLRKALIVFQFTISLVFIIGAMVIGRQIHFMGGSDKGFNSDAIIVVNHWRDKGGKLKLFANDIGKIPGISKTIMQSNAPMGFAQNGDDFKTSPADPSSHSVYFNSGGEAFIPFYQMKLLAGTNIAHTDSLRDLVINETFSKILGYKHPSDAVGKILYHQDKPYPIAGVVADFHQGSFHEAIHPAVIGKMPEREQSVAIKLSGDERKPEAVKSIIASVEKQWRKLYPDEPFNYNFLNESISWLYGQEQNTSWLVNAAMVITIFISCMGLFGLAMFTARRRTREIGIRKVLGASVRDITSLLSKDFLKLVLLALVIASPIAWYFMNQWLQDFVYRTTISVWIFVFAGMVAIVLAIVTVSIQAIKAAMANPVQSLRTE